MELVAKLTIAPLGRVIRLGETNEVINDLGDSIDSRYLWKCNSDPASKVSVPQWIELTHDKLANNTGYEESQSKAGDLRE